MKVEFERDMETIYEVTSQRFKAISVFQKLYRLGFIAGPLLGILLWRLGVIRLEINNNRFTIIEITSTVVLCSVIWTLVYPVLSRNFKKVWIKNLYKEIADRNLDGGLGCIELNEDGVVCKGPHTEQFYGWKVIKKIYETNDFIYLEPISGSFRWIPKNSFQNNEEAIAFLQYANMNFEKNNNILSQLS